MSQIEITKRLIHQYDDTVHDQVDILINHYDALSLVLLPYTIIHAIDSQRGQ